MALLLPLVFSCNKDDNKQSSKQTETKSTTSPGEKLSFKTEDINGKEITSDIFSKYDLTLVNVWATFCGPCKAELPDLQKVYKEYSKKNCNVIALTVDVVLGDDENLELAKEIWKDSGCEFYALKTVQEFNGIFSQLAGVPTSFFVDKQGRIIKETFHTGRLDESGFKKFFEHGLELSKKL